MNMTTDDNASPRRKGGSARRVRACLETLGLDGAILEFDRSTKTAQMAADTVGCELGQIVKSLVFTVDERPVLALVAGDRRGDGDALAALLGGSEAAFASAETVRAATGYAIGGVSPFDLPAELPVFVDDSLARYEVVYPAAGTPSSAVRMTLEQLLAVSGGRVERISR